MAYGRAINDNDFKQDRTTNRRLGIMAVFGLLPDRFDAVGLMDWVGLAVGVSVGTGIGYMVWPSIEASFSPMLGRGRRA